MTALRDLALKVLAEREVGTRGGTSVESVESIPIGALHNGRFKSALLEREKWQESAEDRPMFQRSTPRERNRGTPTPQPVHPRAGSLAEWVEGVALLRQMDRPPRFRPEQWEQLQADAEKLLDQWGAQAAALGWTTCDLFGASPRFAWRLDHDGLAMLLKGRPVVAMTAATATIPNRTGPPNTYRRREMRGAVAMWAALGDA